VLTDKTVAVKVAVVAPAATVTEAGTVTAELLLARPTANPPLAAATFSVTVQLSVPVLVIDPLVQVNPLNSGVPDPLRLTTVDVPLDELLVKVSEPVSEPAAVGSNCTVSVAVEFGLRVSGNVAPETVKPDPATVAALMVTATVPVEEKVTVCVVAVFTFTVPKPMLPALTLSVDTPDPSCRAKVFATLLVLAVKVTV
jgi:hypothetical protein